MSEQSPYRSYTHMNKTGWGDGPWNDEPDKVQWVDVATSLDCLIVRNQFGGLCGYVGVPPEHPCHGAGYDSIRVSGEEDWPEVHGGLTYANVCIEGLPEDRSVCHVPEPGRPADVWWFGFDTGHAGDLQPAMKAREAALGLPPIMGMGETYRTVGYVRAECARLAEQLADAITIEGV